MTPRMLEKIPQKLLGREKRRTLKLSSFLIGICQWKIGGLPQDIALRPKFRSKAKGIYEMIWLTLLLKELSMPSHDPMNLNCTNKATISIAHNPIHLHDN